MILVPCIVTLSYVVVCSMYWVVLILECLIIKSGNCRFVNSSHFLGDILVPIWKFVAFGGCIMSWFEKRRLFAWSYETHGLYIPPPLLFPFELILYLELLLTQHVLIVVIIFMVCLIDYNSVWNWWIDCNKFFFYINNIYFFKQQLITGL